MEGVLDIDALHCKFCSLTSDDGTEVPYHILIDAMAVLTHNLKVKSAVAINKDEKWREVVRKYENTCDELSGKIEQLEKEKENLRSQLRKEKEASAQYQNTLNTIRNAFMGAPPPSACPEPTSTGSSSLLALPPVPHSPTLKHPTKTPSPGIILPAPPLGHSVDLLRSSSPPTTSYQSRHHRNNAITVQTSSNPVHMYCEVPKSNFKTPERRNNNIPPSSKQSSQTCRDCGAVFMDSRSFSHHKKDGNCENSSKTTDTTDRPRPSLQPAADAMNYMQLEPGCSMGKVAITNDEDMDDTSSNASSSEFSSGTISCIENESIHAAASDMVREVEAAGSSLKRKRSVVCFDGVPETEIDHSEIYKNVQKAEKLSEMTIQDQNLTFSVDRFQSTRVGQFQLGSEVAMESPPRVRRKTEPIPSPEIINSVPDDDKNIALCPEPSIILVETPDNSASPIDVEDDVHLLGETTPKTQKTSAEASVLHNNDDMNIALGENPSKAPFSKTSDSCRNERSIENLLEKTTSKNKVPSSVSSTEAETSKAHGSESKEIVPKMKRPGRVRGKSGVITLNTMWSQQKSRGGSAPAGKTDNETTTTQNPPVKAAELEPDSSGETQMIQTTAVTDSIVFYESPRTEGRPPAVECNQATSGSSVDGESDPVANQENVPPPPSSLKTSNENMQQQRQHSKRSQEKKHPCKKCNKSFTTLKAMANHEATHTDTEQFPYQCPLCPRKYQMYSSFKNHQTKCHPNQKKFQCPLCDQKFMKKVGLRMHLTKKHDLGLEDIDIPNF